MSQGCIDNLNVEALIEALAKHEGIMGLALISIVNCHQCTSTVMLQGYLMVVATPLRTIPFPAHDMLG